VIGSDPTCDNVSGIKMNSFQTQENIPELLIRNAVETDLPAIMTFDQRSNKDANPLYWQEMFTRYGNDKNTQLFLVCEAGNEIVGFIIGEVRDWEFGSHPCGWVFALGVRPDIRLRGVATELYTAICQFFRRAGVTTVRTMLARNDIDSLSFFRSQGMMAGPYVQLEKDL
jgi:ribosomal protein S18 acetylase RimI-like enzyme